jgi:hypothetical protein
MQSYKDYRASFGNPHDLDPKKGQLRLFRVPPPRGTNFLLYLSACKRRNCFLAFSSVLHLANTFLVFLFMRR